MFVKDGECLISDEIMPLRRLKMNEGMNLKKNCIERKAGLMRPLPLRGVSQGSPICRGLVVNEWMEESSQTEVRERRR